MNRFRIFGRIAFYAFLLADLALSLQPRASVDAMYSPAMQSNDRLVHALMYFALGASAAVGFVRRGPGVWRRRLAAALALAALGVALEFLQATPLVNRSCSLSDMLHDAAGALAGVLLVPSFLLSPKQP